MEKIVGLLILFIFFSHLDCTLTQCVGNGPRAGEKALRATCLAGDRWDPSGPQGAVLPLASVPCLQLTQSRALRGRELQEEPGWHGKLEKHNGAQVQG